MAKGYWIAHVKVTDPDRYKDYVAANAAAFKKFGARFVVRGGRSETREGQSGDRHVILEFDSYDIAKACYESEEYAKAKRLRLAASEAQVVIVEGV